MPSTAAVCGKLRAAR